MSRTVNTPRLARRMLQRALPADVREHVIADLDEVFERRCAMQGAARARLWYWREAVSFAGSFLRERYRDDESRRRAGGVSWLDVKLGFRMLVKYPGLTTVGTLGMAVAVALAASWFEFSSNLSNPRLPFEDGDRIVRIRNWDVEAGQSEARSLHDYETWRGEVRSIEDLGAASPIEYRLRGEDGRSVPVVSARITPSAFRMLRVRPLLGRTLVDADAEPGAVPAAVIGHDLWHRFFGGDPGVVGRAIRLGSVTTTVVGVMPEGFGFPVNHELWVPFRENAHDYARGQGPVIMVFGRLAPGFTRKQAQAELTAIGARMAAEFPATNKKLRPRVGHFLDVGPIAMFAAGANLIFVLFLFVVGANIATLVFARTATREGEIALRTALGASRRRIVVQLSTEALVLTSVAAILGLSAAAWGLGWGMDLFWEVQQERPPFWFDASVSFSTVLYVAALAVFAALVIGGIPALKATGRRIRTRLAEVGPSGSRLRFGAVSTGVIVAQVAICVIFLPIAVLRGRELLPDRDAAEGFRAGAILSGRLTRELHVAPNAMPEAERTAFFAETAQFQDQVRRRLAADPGVVAITFADRLPGMNHPVEQIRIEGDLVPADSAITKVVRTLAVDVEFFQAMGARVISGRTFTPADLGSAVDVVIVGESFARDAFKGRNVVGQRLRYPERRDGEADRWHEIVGVVEDPPIVKFGAGEYVALYRPISTGEQASIQLFVRAASNPNAMVPRIDEIVESVDEGLAVDELMSLEEIWKPVRRSDRFFIMALSAVSGIALLLSLAGIYSLMAFTVAQRAREIAIRGALGAHPRRIVVAIFSRAAMQIGLGVLVGAVLVSLTALKTPDGKLAVAAVAVLMVLVGMLACAVPAMRALRIAPAEVLRGGG